MRCRPAAIVLAGALAGVLGPPVRGEPVAQVTARPVEQRPVAMSVVGYGTIEQDPQALTNVSLPNAGGVARLYVTAGGVVRRGAALADFSTDPLTVLAYEQARSSLELARAELERTRKLLSQQLATNSQLAQAERNLRDAQAAEAAQRKLGAERPVQTIRAPYDALVTALNVRPGDRVAAGTGLMQLSRLGRTHATIGLPAEDSAKVKRGMEATVTVLQSDTRTISGSVETVQGALNPQTRLVDVWISLASSDASRLLPGQPVRATVVVGAVTGWAVPRSAVLREAGAAYLYQVDRGKARRVSVHVEVETDDVLCVSGAVDSGLKVVTEGNYELADGMAVREATP